LERIQAHTEIIFQRQMTRLFRLKPMQKALQWVRLRLGHALVDNFPAKHPERSKIGFFQKITKTFLQKPDL
jgi:hypothetical protein